MSLVGTEFEATRRPAIFMVPNHNVPARDWNRLIRVRDNYISQHSFKGLRPATVEPQKALIERAKTVTAEDDRIQLSTWSEDPSSGRETTGATSISN